MAAKKATTVADLSGPAEVANPAVEQDIKRIGENTDPAMIAEVEDVKYVTVSAPFSGGKTEVPVEIVDALLESGYKKSK